MSSGTKQTVVEDGTELKGSLTSSCPVLVRGRVEGEVNTPSLLVSENGALHGRAKVGALRSEGELSGEFDADTVELSGRVKDHTVIRAKTLEVKLPGGDPKRPVVFGDCELSVGDAPVDDANVGKRGKVARGKRDGKSEPASSEDTAIAGAEAVRAAPGEPSA